MDRVKMGEIAISYLKARFKNGGIALNRIKDELPRITKELGISEEEALEFIEIVVRESVDEVFASEKKLASKA